MQILYYLINYIIIVYLFTFFPIIIIIIYMKENKTNSLGLYENEDGNLVFYDIFTKKAYIIAQSQFREYNLYSFRPIIAILVGTLIVWLFKDLYWGFIVGVGVYLVLETLFRKNVLEHSTIMKKFEKPKGENYIVTQAKRLPYWRILLIILLFIVLAISIYFMDVRIQMEYPDTDPNQITLIFLFAIISLLVALLYIGILIYKLLLLPKK